MRRKVYPVLASISRCYPSLQAGCPRVTHPSAANLWEQAPKDPLDLHVLGTPPAFVLSQDQTLHKSVAHGCANADVATGRC